MMLAAIALASLLAASEATTCNPIADSDACDLDAGTGGSIMIQRRESRSAKDFVSPATDMQPLSNDKVIVTTVDTRGNESHRLNGPVGWGVFTVNNVGAGKKWQGFKTKVEVMKEYISGLDDDKLVVFVDGSDTMYGGCDLNDLVERYEKIAKATGAPIIAGAENYCFEGPRKNRFKVKEDPLCGEEDYPVHGRNESLSMAGLTQNVVDEWQQPDGKGYKYLNSGWLMGPVGKFREFYDEALAFGEKWTEEAKKAHEEECEKFANWEGHTSKAPRPSAMEDCYKSKIGTDQHWVQQMFHDRPDLVGLDYTTLLVNNIGSRKDGFALEKDGQNLFHFSQDTGKWMSKLTGQPVCFIHFNGCCQEKDTAYDHILESNGFPLSKEKYNQDRKSGSRPYFFMTQGTKKTSVLEVSKERQGS